MNSVDAVARSLHFRPLQVTVKPWHDCAEYIEYVPASALSGLVYCYWRLSSVVSVQPKPFVYRVVPDGCIDIFFNMHSPREARVMGFSSTFNEFELDVPFDYAGIRFLPAAFTTLFGISAASLTEKQEDAHDVIPFFARRSAEVLTSLSSKDKIEIQFDNLLLSHVSSSTVSADKRLVHALDIMLRHNGSVNLARDLQVGMSERQLRRLFEHYVGDTPKAFGRVIRFQYFLTLAQSLKNGEDKSLYLDAGYYDQAHFNKEFKHLFGLTPRQALARFY